MTILSEQECLQYNRQIILKGFDFDKQEALKQARLLIIGVGGLGCAATQYLVSAGVGHITLVDFDTVSRSNLARQILFSEKDIGELKVVAAQKALQRLNPTVHIDIYSNALDEKQLALFIAQHDAVLDCTDNVTTRNQLNQACYLLKVPLISGAAIRMEGLVSVFTYQPDTPCYHCFSRLFGEQQLTCAENGVMAPLVGMIGNIQAMEAIKLITHYGKNLVGKLLWVDAMTMECQTLTLPKQAHCEVCRT